MTNPIHDASHPVWALARLTIVLIALGVILYLTADSFDNTELMTLLSMLFVLAGVELPAFLKAHLPSGNDANRNDD